MHPALLAIPGAVALGGATLGFAAIHPRSQLFGVTTAHTGLPLNLAITFDDGPNPAITPKLLDLLDRYDAKATFFMIGRFVAQCPDLAREVHARGHLIGNHTQTHPNLFWLQPSEVRREMENCQSALQSATGAAAEFFRPPFGIRNPWVVSTAAALGMKTVMWSLIPGDWQGKDAAWLAARMQPIADRAENATARKVGDILCLHDGAHRQLNGDRSATLSALEHWLPRWRDIGLKFATIAQAVGRPAA